MPSYPPLTVLQACHYPQRLFDRQLHLDPPAVAISFVLLGVQNGIAWDSPASARKIKDYKSTLNLNLHYVMLNKSCQ